MCYNSCYNPCNKPKCYSVKPQCYKKCNKIDILHSVSIEDQIVLIENEVIFNNNVILKGNAILHNEGTTKFNLVKSGIYKVTFTGTLQLVEENELSRQNNDTVGVALALDGNLIPGTTVTETVDVGDEATLATQTLICVPKCTNKVLTVINPTENDIIFKNPNIIIERIN